MGTELQRSDISSIGLTVKVKVNDFQCTVSPSISGILTTAVNLCTHAGLRQQQIGELDEHGNINLTNPSFVFTGKQSTSTPIAG